MLSLTPEFMRHALPPSLRQGRDSDSQADGVDAFTLEFRDNPFASLLRRVDKLMDTDPREALRLLKSTIAERAYTGKREISELKTRLDNTLERLRDEWKPEDNGLGRAAPNLNNAFSRGALGLAPAQIAPSSAPAPAAPAPGIAPGMGPS
jgi:hypothetical protein